MKNQDYRIAEIDNARVALFPDGTWTPIIEGGSGEGEGGEGEGTALEGAGEGEGAGAGTALEGAGGGDPDAPIEVPDKFKNEDGTLNEQGVLKSYGELEKKLGGVGAPPETAEGYELELEGKFPEGVEFNEETQKEFLARCHEKGMTNEVVQFIYDEYAGIMKEAANAQAETKEGTVDQLKELYGNDYGDKMIAAMNAFKAAGVEGVDINSVGNNPEMIQILAVLGENLTEDQLPNNMQGGAGGVSEAEIQTLMRSESYWNAKKPDHLEVVAKVTAYHKAKFGTKRKR